MLVNSRVNSTRVLGQAIGEATRPPRVWLQSSTATLYAHRYDAPNDEANGIIGGSEPKAPDTWRFSIDVVTKWEQELNDAATPQRVGAHAFGNRDGPGAGGLSTSLRLPLWPGPRGDAAYVSWSKSDFVSQCFG